VTCKKDEKSGSRSGRLRVLSSVPALEPDVADRDLVALLRERDARGFDAAYARYAARVYGFLVRLTRSRALADDLLQQTFMRLAERGPSLRPESDLRAWLFTVARNALHSHARAAATAARAEPPCVIIDGALTESSLALNELEMALARLTREDRELLLLIGVEGLGPREVAFMFGIDPAVLRKRLSRARARLAEVLDTTPAVVRKSDIRR